MDIKNILLLYHWKSIPSSQVIRLFFYNLKVVGNIYSWGNYKWMFLGCHPLFGLLTFMYTHDFRRMSYWITHIFNYFTSLNYIFSNLKCLLYAIVLYLCHCPSYNHYQMGKFKLSVFSSLTFFSVLSHHLYEHGLCKFLFID